MNGEGGREREGGCESGWLDARPIYVQSPPFVPSNQHREPSSRQELQRSSHILRHDTPALLRVGYKQQMTLPMRCHAPRRVFCARYSPAHADVEAATLQDGRKHLSCEESSSSATVVAALLQQAVWSKRGTWTLWEVPAWPQKVSASV